MDGRVAVVTGGAQGIGRGIVESFFRADFRVAVVDRDGEALKVAEKRIPPAENDMRFYHADVADPEAVKDLFSRILSDFNGLDVLVNNAGIMIRTPPEQLSADEWNRVLAVNLSAPFLCSQAAAPHLRARRGTIINIASTRAMMSEPHTEAYSAAKGGLVALTHALAASFGPEIRVNAISPGWIDVSGWSKTGAAGREDLRSEDHAQHPAGRVGTPEDVARMALFLADQTNDFITGQNFILDGGMTRKMIYV